MRSISASAARSSWDNPRAMRASRRTLPKARATVLSFMRFAGRGQDWERRRNGRRARSRNTDNRRLIFRAHRPEPCTDEYDSSQPCSTFRGVIWSGVRLVLVHRRAPLHRLCSGDYWVFLPSGVRFSRSTWMEEGTDAPSLGALYGVPSMGASVSTGNVSAPNVGA